MALDDIINKIKGDAQVEAQKIMERASLEAEEIREKARRQAEELKAEMLAKAKRLAEEEGERVLTLASLEFRKALLREKQSKIDEAFRQAQDRLVKLERKEYQDLMKNLLMEAVESGEEGIVVSTTHRGMWTDQFLKGVNRMLGQGSGRLKLSGETGDFSGGFILRRGRTEINYSFEAIFKTIREDLEPEVAKILFVES
ncbi:V-type ATP synthase subunit E [candidate division KSB1 bacterium]|nr:V-type ATP synthase subunit E [candidate division KSB1 bacterium]